MSYDHIMWLPLTLGLTILGLVLSYLTYRRRGARPAMLGVAWSLLPIAAYMTGATEMLWKIGAAIGQFGTGFVFSPVKWAGIGVTGLAIALFLAAGGRERRKAARERRRATRGERKGEAAGAPSHPGLGAPRTAPGTQVLPAGRQQVPETRGAAATPSKGARKPATAADDDMKDIEDILRKRGL